jgi:hypothetical protein
MEAAKMKLAISTVLVAAITMVAVPATEVRVNSKSKTSTASVPISDKKSRLSKDYQLIAKPENEIVRSGEAILLKLFLKNIGNKSFFVYESSPVQDYKITVKNQLGEVVPLTGYGKSRLSTAEEYRRVKIELRAGNEVQDSLSISEIYHMNISSNYFITVKRKIFREDGKEIEVISNTVKVKVVD